MKESGYEPVVTSVRMQKGDGLTMHFIEAVTTLFEPMTNEHTPDQRKAMRRANKAAMDKAMAANNAIFDDTLGHLAKHIEDGVSRILSAAGWSCDNPTDPFFDRKWTDAEGKEDNRPEAGVGWYAREIDLRLGLIRDFDKTRDPLATRLPFNIFEVGALLAELSLRVAHNEYFIKQKRTTESQKDAGKATETASITEKREAYFRHAETLEAAGVKTYRNKAADAAAIELEVHVSRIKRAFPNQRLPYLPKE